MSPSGSQDRLRRFLSEMSMPRTGWAGHATLVQEVPQMVAAGCEDLEPGQRATLDIGGYLILFTLGLGLQLGDWSAWSLLPAAGGYLIWVLAYSEATVQATLRQRGRRSTRLAGTD
jgi:hypothetical protein